MTTICRLLTTTWRQFANCWYVSHYNLPTSHISDDNLPIAHWMSRQFSDCWYASHYNLPTAHVHMTAICRLLSHITRLVSGRPHDKTLWHIRTIISNGTSGLSTAQTSAALHKYVLVSERTESGSRSFAPRQYYSSFLWAAPWRTTCKLIHILTWIIIFCLTLTGLLPDHQGLTEQQI